VSLTPAQWSRVTDLFDQVQEFPASKRHAEVEARAADDAAVRDAVWQLLAADVDDDFLAPRGRMFPEVPPGDRTTLFGHTLIGHTLIGQTVGAYRIEEEIGRGGMGVVYAARHQDPAIDKRVAIKTLAIGVDIPERQWRFRRERQILARLEHPNIASLFDGGTTDHGVPYVVMEYVQGQRIDMWCEQQRLTVVQRLDLFRQVCAAVQYAHAQLVVHRDLKPSNMLVTESGVVKLLDFGVAKLLTPDRTDTDTTRTGLAPLTVSFASPEQLRGEETTTSSDVYALGVLLYLLLTGSLPFAASGRSLGELQRLMSTQPPTPSEQVTNEHARQCGAADARPLRATISGDLDAIVLMALRPEASRRYTSVEALSTDVQRFLRGLPVQARPERLSYIVRAFVRRNTALVFAATLSIVALVTATVVSVRSAAQAREEARRASRVTHLLENVFGASDPLSYNGFQNASSDVSFRQVLDSARMRVANALADDPATRADLYRVFGGSYLNLDQLDLAAVMLDSATVLHTQVRGVNAPDVDIDQFFSAELAVVLGDVGRADSLLRALRTRYERDGAPSDSAMVNVLTAIAQVNLGVGELDGVEPLLRAALQREHASPSPRAIPLALNEAMLAFTLGAAESARTDSLVQSALRRLAADSLRAPQRVGFVLMFAAGARASLGQADDALMLARRGNAYFTRAFGSQHPLAAEVKLYLAGLLLSRGATGEARALLDSARLTQLRRPKPSALSLAALSVMETSGALAMRDTAGTRRALATLDSLLPYTGRQRTSLTVQSLWLQAVAAQAQGRSDVAAAHLQEAAQVANAGLGPDHRLSKLAVFRVGEFAKAQAARAAKTAAGKGS
jgi:eukaryotic-like serine/threonine-protein kinase